ALKKAASVPPDSLGRLIAPARLDGLLALRGVLDSSDAAVTESTVIAARDKVLIAGVRTVLERLAASRRGEGGRLAPVIAGHLDEIERLCGQARALAALQPQAIQ